MKNLIRTAGYFWNEEYVYWGKGRQPGKLLGVPDTKTTAQPIDFREQVGVYALYANFRLVYVGQTGLGNRRLLDRLKDHRDDLRGRWDRFSWFGVRRVRRDGSLSAVTDAAHPTLATVLNHMEAIIIDTAEPPLNSQSGRFGDEVTWYLQRRDPRLGPSDSDMIREILALVKKRGL